MSQHRAERLRRLRDSIAAETASLARFVETLRKEQDEIVARTPAGLETAVREKIAAYEDVQRCRDDRIVAMKGVGLPLDPVAAEVRLSVNAELSRLWKAMRRETREAALLNALNARLVVQRMQYVTARIDALREASGRQPIYDASGRAGDRGPKRSIAAA